MSLGLFPVTEANWRRKTGMRTTGLSFMKVASSILPTGTSNQPVLIPELHAGVVWKEYGLAQGKCMPVTVLTIQHYRQTSCSAGG